MQIPADVRRIGVRYVPYNGPAVLPDWASEPTERPRICLTWGATTTALGGPDSFLPPRIVAALEGLDADIVVAVAERDRFDGVPPNVRVVSGVALHQVLPACSALIQQGGFGSTLTGVYYGVPQLVLPQLPDQTFAAARLAATGAAEVLPRGEFTPEAVRSRVEALLDGPAHRAAAAGLRAEMLAQPAPADIVPDLERVAASVLVGGRS